MVKVDVSKIIDFKGIKEEDIKSDLITYHKMIDNNFFNGEETIFVGGSGNSEILNKDLKTHESLPEVEEFLQMLIDKCGIYKHQWEDGDMLIWDNIQVMHRS